MRYLLFLLGVCFLVFLNSCSRNLKTIISYTISPVEVNDKSMLKVNMSFKIQPKEETILLFQDNGWGEDTLQNVIYDMKLLNAEAEIIKNEDSGYIIIKHPKNLKTLDFEYIIQQDTEGRLTTQKTYRPIIQPEYFHVFSHNFFMIPKNYTVNSSTEFNVNIHWNGFPSSYNFQNSFGSNQLKQEINGITEEKFHSAVFVGGDFRIYNININDNKIAFAIRDEWQSFKDSTLTDILNKTITAQRDFWNDHTQDYFSITMIPTFLDRGSSYQGSGLTNSFATSATNNQYLEIRGLVYLFNHELQHNWIGQLIKNDNEEQQYWFSEGFTDYYTIKNIVKNRIYSFDESYFIDEFNGIVRALYTSPVKEAPNRDINYSNFWSNRYYSKLPYQRGALFAFYLDYKIAKDTEGQMNLRNVMLEFKHDAIHKKQTISHSYFIEKLNKYLKDDIKPFFNIHIEQGKLFDLEEIYNELDFEYTAKAKVFDLGFTFSEGNRSVIAIDENSKAYEAGLRLNDKFTSLNLRYNDIENKAKFKVLRDNKEVVIEYYPVKEAYIPQLKNSQHNRELIN